MDINAFIAGLQAGQASAPAGGVELNLAFGDTPPKDTSKLWVKASASEIASLQLAPVQPSDHKLVTLSKTLPSKVQTRAAAVGSKVYLFGGYTTDGYLDTITVFDKDTQKVETLSKKMPFAFRSPGVAAVGKKIYLFGGNSGTEILDTIYEFDTETNDMCLLSSKLPVVMQNLSCVAVGKKIYIIGGYSKVGEGSAVNLDTINVFDTETNEVKTLSVRLPAGIQNPPCAAVGTKIFLFGGYAGEYRSSIYEFDTEAQKVTTARVGLNEGLSSMSVVALGQKIYILGGYNGLDNRDTSYVFDAVTQKISSSSVKLPAATRSAASAIIGQKAYLFGGYSGGSNINRIDAFNLTFPLDKNTLVVAESLFLNLFYLLPNVEIGVESVYKGNASNKAEPVEAYIYRDGEWSAI